MSRSASRGAGTKAAYHRLLARQIRKSGIDPDADPKVNALLALVNEAYLSSDEDRRLLEHAMELSSKEMVLANRELGRLIKQATQAMAAKSQFLANMSHEIRTPLNGIIGLSDMLLDEVIAPDHKKTIEVIQRSGSSLLRIINDVLDISKMEAGKLSIVPVATNLKGCCEEMLEVFGAAFRDKKIEFVLDCHPSVPSNVMIDEARLRQVLTNLVANSVKFTPAGGGVVVYLFTDSISAEGAEIHLAVADTGIGIPEDKLALIFEAFSQADDTITKKFGGTGLGLSISQRLMDMMGGRIWVRSKVGVGSIFHLAISCPIAVPASPTAQNGSAINASTVPARKLRVLLAEDSPINQKVALHALTKFNCVTTVANNGLEGVAAFEREPFDLILMDCHMPEMSGFEAARKIRTLEKGGRIPIIAFTALAMAGDRELCLDAGMDDYLAKPFKQGDLKRILDHWGQRTDGPTPDKKG